MSSRPSLARLLFVLGLAGTPALAQAPLDRASATAASPKRTTPDPFEFTLLPQIGPEPVEQPGESYTVLSADLERDGDLDILINWHISGPLELWENRSGRYWLHSAPGADRSGIFDNRDVPYLYVDAEEQLEAIEADGGPGLWVWHDVDRRFGSWRFYARRETAGVPLEIEILTNQPIIEFEGLSDVEWVLLDPERLLISLEDAHLGRTFSLRMERISTQLIVRQSEPALETFAGRERVPKGTGELELWKHDPHGIAWMPPRSGPEPELYVSRGGLMGSLLPPNDPKFDFAYDFVLSGGRYFTFEPDGFFERSYGRTRQVEWVDVDGDGTNELYVGNNRSRNTLARFEPKSGRYVDRAADSDLALLRGESFGWMDLDDDGDDDLVFLGVDDLRVRRNDGGQFVPIDSEALGLSLQGIELRTGYYLERPQVIINDFDNDGRLDVLVTTVGEFLGYQFFLRRGDVFVNATSNAGLLFQRDAVCVATLDFDNDGFLDFFTVADQITLFRNEEGQGFSPMAFQVEPLDQVFRSVATTDVDGDGREDAVILSDQRILALNRTVNGNTFLRVDLTAGERLPIGALVSAHYADGSVRVQRFGSANNPKFSQALTPLHFGVPSSTTLESISVRWPGSGDVTVRPIDACDLGTTIAF